MNCRLALATLVFPLPFLLATPLFGCSKIAGWAIDKAIGDDAGLAEQALAGGGTTSTKKACDLLTNAEIEAATGKKIVKRDDSSEGSCAWSYSASGKDDPQSTTMGNVSLQIANELATKVIPTFGEPKAIPGLGTKAEWVGGMAPNLRIHMSDGTVLFFMFVDPSLMMKNTGTTEKKIDNNNTAVNMEYPEVEKMAITLGKLAVARY